MFCLALLQENAEPSPTHDGFLNTEQVMQASASPTQRSLSILKSEGPQNITEDHR